MARRLASGPFAFGGAVRVVAGLRDAGAIANRKYAREIAVKLGLEYTAIRRERDLVDHRADQRHRFGFVFVVGDQPFEFADLAGIEPGQVRMQVHGCCRPLVRRHHVRELGLAALEIGKPRFERGRELAVFDRVEHGFEAALDIGGFARDLGSGLIMDACEPVGLGDELVDEDLDEVRRVNRARGRGRAAVRTAALSAQASIDSLGERKRPGYITAEPGLGSRMRSTILPSAVHNATEHGRVLEPETGSGVI